jgi:hypothetical protein
MAGIWTEVARELALRVDEDLIARVTRETDVDADALRRRLDQHALAYDAPKKTPRPTIEALAITADALIHRAARRAAMSGALTGMAGLVGVPAEVGLRLLLTARLGQQLAIVYGHDPSTDKGRILVRRALAAAYELELPRQQAESARLRDLRAIARSSDSTQSRTAWLARSASRHTLRSVRRSLGRKIPAIGLFPGALHARRTVREQGQRMHQVLVRSWEWPTGGPIENAVEIARG